MTDLQQSSSPFDVFEKVVSGGYCIGCGACAATKGSGLSVTMDDEGRYLPVAQNAGSQTDVPENFAAICPFSGEAADENMIADDLFASEASALDDGVGRYVDAYAGHVVDPTQRLSSSSGGLATWLLCKALETGLIDAVIHVKQQDGPHFGYCISRTIEAVKGGAKSRYYPVELSQVLQEVRSTPGNYAFVGVPCFIKAINLQRRADPVLAKRIAMTAGIFCGHLKSARFAEYLVSCLGEEYDAVKTIDFRKKYTDGQASNYGFEACMNDGRHVSKPMSEIYGGNWGYGFFKYEACETCDDVTAETADVAFGDAWLGDYVVDPKGSNVVVTRTQKLDALIKDGIAKGELALKPVPVSRVVESQAGGLRDRREGLSYRLALKKAEGVWAPNKRVAPSLGLPTARRRIYDLRKDISKASHRAFVPGSKKSVAAFVARMKPLTDKYDKFYQPSAMERVCKFPRRLIGKLWREVKSRFR
jgi:coenzyme F420 hydrogenase subunit beta